MTGRSAVVERPDFAAEAQRIHLNASIARYVDRHPHHLDQRSCRRGKAVPAHQGDIVGAEAAGEIAGLFHVGDQHVGVGAEPIRHVPHRHVGADEAARMDDRAQRRRGNRKRQHILRMGVHHSLHVRPRLVDAAMNEPLVIKRAAVIAHRRAIEIERDDMIFLDHLGRHRGREQEAARIVRMAHAHMAIGVHHILAGQDAVGDDEVAHQGRDVAHEGPWVAMGE